MNEQLKKDIALKIVSVLTAILLWFIVLDIDNPFGTRTFEIPITLQNVETLQEKNLSLKSYPTTISFTAKGRKDKISTINFNDFQAILDLSKVKTADTRQLPVDIYVGKDDIWIENSKQQTINIELERIVEATFPVEIEVTGEPAKNYSVIRKAASPSTVQVVGTESLINSIELVKVTVDIDKTDSDITVRKECKFMTAKGEKEINELKKSRYTDVAVELAKEIPLTEVIKGKPAEDFVFVSSSVQPEKVFVRGPADALSKLEELQTEPVDLTNADKNVEVARRILLPAGMEIAGPEKEARVTAVVEQLAYKNFTIGKDSIILLNSGAEPGRAFEILTQNITVGIKGRRADLEQLNAEGLKPSVDVEKLQEGTYTLPLKLTLGANMKQVENYNVEVKITKK